MLARENALSLHRCTSSNVFPRRMRLLSLMALVALGATGCGSTTGIVPVGPDTYFLTEMRAPVLGGGDEARRVVMAEAIGFCQQQGRVFVPLDLRPDGDPRTPYYPTAFDATFRCVAPQGPAGGVGIQTGP
jgi:hypothetical protein